MSRKKTRRQRAGIGKTPESLAAQEARVARRNEQQKTREKANVETRTAAMSDRMIKSLELQNLPLPVCMVVTGNFDAPPVLPDGERMRIESAVVDAADWFDELNSARGDEECQYDPRLILIGGDNGAWRWILDIRRDFDESLREGVGSREALSHVIAGCMAEFGNAARTREIELDGSETFKVGSEVASRANAAGMRIFPLPTDEELGFVRGEHVHCAECLVVFCLQERERKLRILHGDDGFLRLMKIAPDIMEFCEDCDAKFGVQP